MFNFVNQKKTIVQVVLAIALTPFLFWGLESYQGGGGTSYVAVVDGEEISRQEYEQALRNQQENLRSMLGDNFDAALLDNPQMRLGVLENLIQQKLLLHEADRVGLIVMDSRLTAEIQNISFFHEDDKFSYERYQDMLQRQGMSPAMFEARVMGEILRQQLLEGIGESTIVPEPVAAKVLTLSETQYEINRITINPEQYITQVAPDEAAIQAYYDERRQAFALPERVRVEYVVLSLDDLAQQEHASTEEAKKYFDGHQDEFGQPEERQASHILLTVPTGATEEEKAAIKTHVEQILEQLRQDPDKFPELAKEFSEDPGSAKTGGDLGFFARGLMAKPFEDEVFQMQPDEIHGPVETQFGFHIIKLIAVKGADTASFEDVEEPIKKILLHEKAAARFGEVSEDFSNIVYEQSETLKPVAEMFNLPIQQSDWINRKSKEPPVIANERMLQAIFSEGILQDKYNTEAVEVAHDTFVSARLLEHRSASTQSLELVKDEIIELLKQQLAAEMAGSEGKQKLASLQAGEAGESVEWGEPFTVTYTQRKSVDENGLRALFQAEVEKLPAYAGVSTRQGGFDLIRINHITVPAVKKGSPEYKLFADQLRQARSQEELNAYAGGLRERYDVEVKPISSEDE